MTQEYVIQRKGAVISEGENSFVPEEGLRAAEYRLIGNTPDAQASVILLCESRNPSQWAGIIGRIYALRGWKESFNISWMIDVVCTQSYADNKIFDVGAKIGTGQASIQAGTCEYQGKTYLALSVGNDSTMTLFFTGLHSGDCLFSIVNLNDVSWNE